jgi:hypothetical protein
MERKLLVITLLITCLFANPTCDNNPLLNREINPNAPSQELIPHEPVKLDAPDEMCGQSKGSESCCSKDAIEEQQEKWSDYKD